MARPRKKRGFRPIVVDGARYLWRVDDCNRTADLEVYLETEANHGQRLCVNAQSSWPTPITGEIVSQIIREAIKTGWCPKDPGADCSLELTEAVSHGEVVLTKSNI